MIAKPCRHQRALGLSNHLVINHTHNQKLHSPLTGVVMSCDLGLPWVAYKTRSTCTSYYCYLSFIARRWCCYGTCPLLCNTFYWRRIKGHARLIHVNYLACPTHKIVFSKHFLEQIEVESGAGALKVRLGCLPQNDSHQPLVTGAFFSRIRRTRAKTCFRDLAKPMSEQRKRN